MNFLRISLLAASLALSGTATAQSYGYPQPPATYGTHQGATYDYARVLRVDPVIRGGTRGQSATGAQNCRYRPADDVYTQNGGSYGEYATGGRSDPYRRDDYYGRDDGYAQRGNETSRTVATVIGGIAGAVLGSKIGDGGGRYVGTAVGSMVGGMAGRSIYDSTQRNRVSTRRGTVSVCDPLPVGGDGGYVNGGYDGGGYSDDDYDSYYPTGYGGNGYGNESLIGYQVTYQYAGRTYQTRTDHHPGDRIRVRVDVRPE